MVDELAEEVVEAALEGAISGVLGGALDPVTFMFRVVRFITHEHEPSPQELRAHYEKICREHSIPIVDDTIIDEVIDEVL